MNYSAVLPAIAASNKRVAPRFWAKVDRRGPHDCWPWRGQRNAAGYGKIMVDGRWFIASRVSYALSTNEEPGQLAVCHECDNPCCVNPAHLWLGSVQENNLDKCRKGRAGKLTCEQVGIIKRSTRPGSELAAEFGVTKQAISEIRRGRNWSWMAVEGAPAPVNFTVRANLAAKLYLEGLSAREVAQKLSLRNYRETYRLLKRAGISHRHGLAKSGAVA